nr:MAG TPA_asm: hypothetical protein [Caudoviricetes sp.]
MYPSPIKLSSKERKNNDTSLKSMNLIYSPILTNR